MNNDESYKSIYAGMSIFNIIKNSEFMLENYKLSLEDKKYLSLYFGVKVAQKFYNMDCYLSPKEYSKIYLENFVEIFEKFDLLSSLSILEHLESIDIINRFNSSNKKIILVKE